MVARRPTAYLLIIALFIPDRFANLNNAPAFKKVGIWSGTLPHAVKKRATGTFFEYNKATIYKLRETFYLAKSFPYPSKIRFVLRNFAFCGKRFKAPP